METKDICMILINALLVLVIVCVYIHLSQLIKHDGIQIQVLTDKVKESMSQAQRYGLAGIYAGKKQNQLLATDKRPSLESSKPFGLVSSTRFNNDVSALNKTKVVKSDAATVASNIGVNVVDAVQNGAATVSAVSDLQKSATIETDDSQVVAPEQNGQISTEEFTSFAGVNSRVQPPAAYLFTSNGSSVVGAKAAATQASQ